MHPEPPLAVWFDNNLYYILGALLTLLAAMLLYTTKGLPLWRKMIAFTLVSIMLALPLSVIWQCMNLVPDRPAAPLGPPMRIACFQTAAYNVNEEQKNSVPVCELVIKPPHVSR